MGGNQTTVVTIGTASGITTILFWLIGFYQPELMAAAPAGVEAGVTGIVAATTGWIRNANN